VLYSYKSRLMLVLAALVLDKVSLDFKVFEQLSR
jgi:hypothetical protein